MRRADVLERLICCACNRPLAKCACPRPTLARRLWWWVLDLVWDARFALARRCRAAARILESDG